jgi:MinD-like ATPase involved in chromosome partitioning or flagellar assembly
MPVVTCFFSTKGGTGRSLALANTAVLAARSGLRVGCIDFDVMAPGLASIFGCEDDGGKTTSSVLDLLLDPDDTGQIANVWIDVGRKLEGLGRDKLYLMAARHEPKEKMETAAEREIWTVENIQSFYRSYIGTFNVKKLDHVFVDCRSGLTNESMCGLALSLVNPDNDRIAAFFRLDPQSRSGVHWFLKYCEEYNFESKPLLFATNVPAGNQKLKLKGRDFSVNERALEVLAPFCAQVTRDFGIEVSGAVTHDPELIVDHKLVVITDPKSPTTKCYQILFEEIIQKR